MMAVRICAVVTMAARVDKDGKFDSVTAKQVNAGGLTISHPNGDVVVGIGADQTDGYIYLQRPQDKDVMWLKVGDAGGRIRIKNLTDDEVVWLEVDEYGNGLFTVR